MVRVRDGKVIYPYTIANLRKDEPDVSFPATMSEEVLNSFNVFNVEVQEIPEHNRDTQKIVTSKVPVLVEGTWTILREVVDLTEAEKVIRQNSSSPKVVTMRQARLALLEAGLLTVVEKALTDSADEALKIEWEYGTTVKKGWQGLTYLINTSVLTDKQVIDMFAIASTK